MDTVSLRGTAYGEAERTFVVVYPLSAIGEAP